MRKLWLIAAVASIAVVPEIAFSAVYDFSSTETSALGDPAYTFSLDTSKAVLANGVTSFSGVTIDDSGTTSTGNTISLVSPTTISGPSFFFIDTDVPTPKPLFSGSGTDTVFNTGSFSIADGFTEGEGVLTISEGSVSAAPEPNNWLLMFAGVGGIGLMLRRAKYALAV